MFVISNAFLISVSTPLGLTIVNDLGYTKGERSLTSVAPALIEQLDTYSSRQFNIKSINSDCEGAIIAMTQVLNQRGIVINPAGPGSRVSMMERKIQEVKQRFRGIIINTLPSLMVHLIIFVVS